MKGSLSESNGAKTEQKQSKNRAKTGVCEISQPLRNRHFAAKPVRSLRPLSAKIFAAAKPILAHECHFAAQEPPFRSCETAAKLQNMKNSQFRSQSSILKSISRLRNHFLAHECHLEALYTHFTAAKWLRNLHTLKSFSAHTINRHVTTVPPFRQLLDTIRSLTGAQIIHTISCFKSWEVRSL